MAAEKPETDGFLAVIEAKIGALKTLADSYRAALSLGALGQPGDVDLSATIPSQSGTSNGVASGPIELPVGVFRSKTIPDAIRLFLAAARRKQTTRDIAVGVRQGGLETTATHFEATITGALHRLKRDGVVLRFRDGWDLAEHYPDHIRNKLEAVVKSKGKARAKKRSAKKTRPGQTKASSRMPEDKVQARLTSGGHTIDQEIIAHLGAHAGQRFLPKEIGEALKESDGRRVGMAFARLVHQRRLTKDNEGRYSILQATTEHRLKAV